MYIISGSRKRRKYLMLMANSKWQNVDVWITYFTYCHGDAGARIGSFTGSSMPNDVESSVAYKVLTTAQPGYLHNLISLQPPRSTRSLTVVTLFSRPPTISSLKIIDHLFRYASPRLSNQLPDSFRQLHHFRLDSPPHPLLNSSLSSSPLSSSITPSLFHSRLKTYLFNKSFPP